MPEGLIQSRVEKLAWQIFHDYKGKTLHLLVVLKGAY